MKGHRFDWRVKRRPPFRVFITITGGEFGPRALRVCRHPTPKRAPMLRWLGKRGTQRFFRAHGIDPAAP